MWASLSRGAAVTVILSLAAADAIAGPVGRVRASAQERSTNARSARPTRELRPNVVLLERHVAAGVDSYAVQVRAGDFIRVVVHPSGGDLGLRAYDPQGTLLATTDYRNRRYGPEPLSFIAVQRGTYRIDVGTTEPATDRSVEYRIELLRHEPATPALREELAAERAFHEGLWLSGGVGLAADAEQLRAALGRYAEAGRLYRGGGNELGVSNVLAATGVAHNGLHAYADARAALEAAVVIKRRIGDRIGEGAAVNDLGWSLYSQGEKERARERYEQAIAITSETADRQMQAWARSNRGLVLHDLGDQAEAAKEFDVSLTLHRQVGDRRGEAVVLNNLSMISQERGDYRGAIALLERSFDIDRQLGADAEGAQVLMNISNNYTLLGDFDQADALSRQALEFSIRAGSKHHQGAALLSIGAGLANRGEHQGSLQYKERALALFVDTGNRSWQAHTWRSLGRSHYHLGELQKAIDEYSSALAILEASGERSTLSGILRDVGDAFTDLYQPETALDWYRRALDLAREVGDRGAEAQALNRMGRMSLDIGRSAEAMRYLDESARLCRRMGLAIPEGDALLALGDLARMSGDGATAARRYQAALTIYERASSPQRQAKALLSSGLLAESRGDAARALRQYVDSLRLARQVQTPITEGLALSRMLVLANASGAPQLAVFYGKQAVNVFQSVRSNITALDRETQRAFADSKAETYRNLAELLIVQGRLPEAQQVLELLKEEEYFDFIRRSTQDTAGADKRAQLTPEEVELDSRYRAIADDIAAIGYRRGALARRGQRTQEEERQLAELDEALNLAGAAFQRFLDRLSSEFRAEQRDTERLFQVREAQGLMETLRALGPGTVAVYTLVGREKLRLLLITPDVQKAAEYTIRAADLNRLIFDFRTAAEDPRRDPLPAARKLYDAVIRPIQRDLTAARSKTIMWSLDGALRYVPISALHDGQRFVVERFGNVLFTPASHSRLKDEPSRTWRGLGLGVSKRIEPFPALPLVPEELQAIIHDERTASRGVVPGRLILDEAFTAETMRAELRKQYSLVHIATHFVFQPGNETSSFLLLGDARRLSLAEVKRMHNVFEGVELLTLSACNTAIGGTGEDGREVEAFALLAQRQGAKSVLASLWPVADASTAVLMRAFYQARAGRSASSKLEALRRAQLAMLKGQLSSAAPRRGSVAGLSPEAAPGVSIGEKQSTRHPFYWAPFILVGNWK